MSSTNVQQSNNPLHYAHVKSAVNKDTLIVPVLKGLLKFPNADHAVSNGYMRHVVHELQPRRTPQTDFFSGTNNFVDVELPQDMHFIDKMDLHMDLKNSDSQDTSFNNAVSNLISRYEIRVGSEIKETVTDVEHWMSQIPYHDPWHLDRKQDVEKIDPTTYKVGANASAATIAMSATESVSVPLRNFVTAAGLPTSAVSEPITLRFYSQNASNVITNTTDFDLTDFKIHAREKRILDHDMARAVSSNMDWRYLQPKLEERSIALTSGSTTKTVLNNFNADDLCSHLWVLIRTSSHTGTAQDDYLTTAASNIYIEDEAGQNITNGIQWKTTDLLDKVYPDKFQNKAKDFHGLYLPLCPSQDPVADYKKGAQTGVMPLSRNMKLCITASTTGTYYVSVIAMCQRHVRTENGKVQIQ